MLSKLDSSHSFTWVARKVDAETSQRIRDLNLRGIYFQKESKRFYPKRELAAQVLGWVGMDDEGLGGLEHVYDDQLHGRPGAMYVTMDARRKWFGRVERDPEPGQNVVLTIDEKIQYIAERELETAMEQTKAKTGTVIVENPHTGKFSLWLTGLPTTQIISATFPGRRSPIAPSATSTNPVPPSRSSPFQRRWKRSSPRPMS